MPGPLAIPIIAAGASLAGAAINAGATGSMNKKTRKWNEKMYGIQRADALADWERQNQYNSPAAQMQRLKDARLNPHLVYGDGATATSSQSVRSASAPSWNPETPNYGTALSGTLNAYFDARFKQNTVDNMALQREILEQEKLLKMAEVTSTLERGLNLGLMNEEKRFDIDLKKEMRDTSLSMMNEELRRLQISNQVALNQDERAAASNASNLREAVERILSMRAGRKLTEAQVSNLVNETELKRLDIQLKEKGIQPGDAIYWRVLGRILGDQKLSK